MDVDAPAHAADNATREMTAAQSTDQLRLLALIAAALAALAAGILWGGSHASLPGSVPEAGNGVTLDSTTGANEPVLLARKGRAPAKGKKS